MINIFYKNHPKKLIVMPLSIDPALLMAKPSIKPLTCQEFEVHTRLTNQNSLPRSIKVISLPL